MASQSDTDWGAFSSQSQVATTYDAQGRPTKTTASTGGPTPLKVTQLSYDSANVSVR